MQTATLHTDRFRPVFKTKERPSKTSDPHIPKAQPSPGKNRFLSILAQGGAGEALAAFSAAVLQPLQEYDRTHNGELVKSLRAYFQANGNCRKMSDALFIHYNTAVLRIQRIQDISGLNLDSELDRYQLQSAILVMELLQP